MNGISAQIALDELVRLPLVFGPVVSYGQDYVAYFSTATGRTELYVQALAGGPPRQVTRGEVPRTPWTDIVWNRAGTSLVFGRDRNGNENNNLVRVDLDGSGTVSLTDHPDCQEFPVAFGPDDAWILLSSNFGGQHDLWRMRPDGSEYTQVTHHGNVLSGRWSPDGQRIAFNANESADLGNLDGYVINQDGTGARRVLRVEAGTEDQVVDWSSDGKLLAVVSNASGFERPGLLNVDSGELSWFTEADCDEVPTRFSSDGRWLLCHRSQEAESRPVLYEVATGRSRVFRFPPGFAAAADFALNDSAIVVLYATETRRPELILYSLEHDTVRVIVPAEYGNIDPSIFVAGEHVWYPSADGCQIPALLYKPRDIDPGARLPAVIEVHGGPAMQWYRHFTSYVQARVMAGYVVLLPNIRGSAGYGTEFRDAARFDWGGKDLEDVVAGAEYLSSFPFVDPERLAITGTSYGGFITLLAAVKWPGLWKAAVSRAGISDLRRLYDSSMEHLRYFLREQMGDPEENVAKWSGRSPANLAGELRARLLIIHGVNDPRCPVDQARYFRDQLLASGKRLGADFEYVEFKEEGHSSTDTVQRLRAFKLEAEFLARVL